MKENYFKLLLVSILMLATTALWAQQTVTVTLVDENGTELANYPSTPSEMSYKYRNPGWTGASNIQTDGSGQFTVTIANDASWDGKISLTLHQKLKEMVVTAGAVTFQTAKVNVNLRNACTGLITDASGGTVSQGGGHWYTHGTTAGTGIVSFYTFPGNVKLKMNYNWKSITQNPVAIVAGVNEVDFITTNVNIIAGSVQYQTSGWPTVTFPTEFLQGNHNLRIDGAIKTIAVSSCSLTGGFITLVDEAGNPLANYPSDFSTETRNLKWKYRCGGSWGPSTSFQTDANGQVFYNIDCVNNNWDSKITMTLNQTTLEQDVTVNPVFQAAKVNVNLKTCDGLITDTPGGTVKQGGGFWYTHGTTGTAGTVSLYAFPSTSIKLRMKYNHGTQTLFPPVIAGTNEVDFTTTALTLVNSGGGIKSNKGGSWWTFAQPTMNLLPGVYNFKFQTGSTWTSLIPVNVTGCEMNSLLANIKLIQDETEDGIESGVVRYTPGGNNWSTLGTTDNNGNVFALIPSGTGLDRYKMIYKGQWMHKWHNMETGGTLVFNTRLVTMRINDGTSDVTGTDAMYHGNAGGEWLFGSGTTTTSMQMLDIPNGIKFYVTYDGGTLTRNFHKFSVDGDEVLFTVTPGPNYSDDDNYPMTDLNLYPNPFRDHTTFRFQLEEETNVTIVVYDLYGRAVKTLTNLEYAIGTHEVIWDGTSDRNSTVLNGIYLLRIKTGTSVSTRKIIFNK